MNRPSQIALIAFICALSMVTASGVKIASGQAPGPGLPAKYVSDQILVRFAPGVPASARAAAHAAIGSSALKRFETLDGLELVKLPRVCQCGMSRGSGSTASVAASQPVAPNGRNISAVRLPPHVIDRERGLCVLRRGRKLVRHRDAEDGIGSDQRLGRASRRPEWYPACNAR